MMIQNQNSQSTSSLQFSRQLGVLEAMQTDAPRVSSPTSRTHFAGRIHVVPAVVFRASLGVSLGAWTLAAIGCASTPTSSKQTTQAQNDTALTPASATTEGASRPTERVVFSDEPASITPTTTDSAAGVPNDQSLVQALASSYSADMESLAQLQAEREKHAQSTASAAAATAASTAAPTAATTAPTAVNTAPTAVTTASTAVTAVNPAPTAATTAPTTAPTAVTTAATAPTTAPTTVTAAPTAATTMPTAVNTAPTTAPSTVTTAPSTAITHANTALEIPPVIPTDPAILATLLAQSLALRGGSSAQPMSDWIAYSALALTNPELRLPDNFGEDLLPAERERITKVHSAFALMGRLLAKGEEIDATTTEALIAALDTGPKFEIPKVELCTRVESFGHYSPLGSHAFVARSNARVIVYSELAGFASDLEGGEFVTRLATRVALESESDGVEVWSRSPDWTAVVDTSPVRRSDFFVGEIIPISELLAVGSYRLKVQIRDETSGRVATSFLPITVVNDPALAAVAD